MEQRDILESGGFYFLHNFDSGNLGHVERVPTEHISPALNPRTNNLETPNFEFNIWTRPDCYGTEFENGNRTWFYFGIRSSHPGVLVRLNIINLNKQGKMYSQGMAPVTRTLPGQPHWERIRDKPVHSTDDNTFMLSFKYRTSGNMKAITYFAFTYPYSFTELQTTLNIVDQKLLPLERMQSLDDIYYCRENLIYTLDKRRTDLLTISSYHGITDEREERLKNLFPDRTERPFKFQNKKVIFISARVHPGETPSSFVFNGFLNLLLTRNDTVAILLRKLYVFKLIPFLNPDGVARGHYRTDTRGVNLNRVYLNPSLEHHPTVYAARTLIRYHHYGFEREEDPEDTQSVYQAYSRTVPSINEESVTTVEDVKNKKKSSTVKSKHAGKFSPPPSFKSLATDKSFVSSSTNTTDITTASKVENLDKNITGDKLAEQVCDLKLQEIETESQIVSTESALSAETCIVGPSSSYLLNNVIIRDCLGSEVHISRSDELSHLQGPNPLRQLRNTLKNSISLLINGSPYVMKGDDFGDNRPKDGSSQGKDTEITKVENTDDMDPSLANTPESKDCTIGEELKAQHVYYAIAGQTKEKAEIDTEIKKNLKVEVVPSGDTNEVCSPTASSEEPTEHVNGDNGEQTKPKPSKARKKPPVKAITMDKKSPKEPESGLFLYIDLHGHASKKGIFMYGNHFDEPERCVECMLLPRIMSLNNLHFHFSSCNFTERNMYLKDRRDGMSREGSGRVAVLKTTGLIRSYTLECNYNTGRLVNVLPPSLRDAQVPNTTLTPPAPPKYTPHIFEEVGRSLGASILDLTNQHPNSRIPASEHRTLATLKEWLRSHMRTMRPTQLTMSRLRPKASSPMRVPLYSRTTPKNKLADVERKENTYIGAKSEEVKKPVTRSVRPADVAVSPYPILVKKTDKFGSRTRCFVESDAKPKSLTAKRRSVLAIRKPNAGKARVLSAGKNKSTKRVDEPATATNASSRVNKTTGSFSSRSCRKESRSESLCTVMPSSSSEEAPAGSWEDGPGTAAAIKRRPYPPPLNITAPRLKKIRLKNSS